MSLADKIKNAKTGVIMPNFDITAPTKIDKLTLTHFFIYEHLDQLMVEKLDDNLELIYLHDMPEIIGVGENRVESTNDLARFLLDCYEEYAECDESELTTDALKLREWLLQNLKQPLTN